MPPGVDGKMVPLMDGAFSARLPYRKALDAVLRGSVPGERRGRSWWVDREALQSCAAGQEPPDQPDGAA